MVNNGTNAVTVIAAVKKTALSTCNALTTKLNRVLIGAIEVDKAILFSVIITIAAFLPLFTMQGVEGQIFGPMSPRSRSASHRGSGLPAATTRPTSSPASC